MTDFALGTTSIFSHQPPLMALDIDLCIPFGDVLQTVNVLFLECVCVHAWSTSNKAALTRLLTSLNLARLNRNKTDGLRNTLMTGWCTLNRCLCVHTEQFDDTFASGVATMARGGVHSRRFVYRRPEHWTATSQLVGILDKSQIWSHVMRHGNALLD